MVRNTLLLLLILLLAGCLDKEDYDTSYNLGLETVSLKISDEDFNNIYKTSYVNEWIFGNLKEGEDSCKVRIRRQGKSSRKYPKPSFKSIGSFESVVYSSQYFDKSFSRYYLADYLFRKAGLYTPDLQPVSLSINNKFMGLYLKREFIDEDFFKKRGISVSSLYKVNHGVEFTFKKGMSIHSGFEKKIPNGDLCFADLERLISLLDSWEKPGVKEQVIALIDVENILDYYVVSVLLSNYDCITYNFYFAMNRDMGKFQFVPWDLDRTLCNLSEDLPIYENGLFEKLLQIEEYSDYVERRKKDLFDPVELKSVLSEYAAEIERAYRADPYLNGREFEYHQSTIHTFIDSVTSYLNR